MDFMESHYTAVRFTHAITFRGITVDSIQDDDRFCLEHAPGALLVYLVQVPTGQSPQVRMVPWPNVACAEPTAAQLERLRGLQKGKK